MEHIFPRPCSWIDIARKQFLDRDKNQCFCHLLFGIIWFLQLSVIMNCCHFTIFLRGILIKTAPVAKSAGHIIAHSSQNVESSMLVHHLTQSCFEPLFYWKLLQTCLYFNIKSKHKEIWICYFEQVVFHWNLSDIMLRWWDHKPRWRKFVCCCWYPGTRCLFKKRLVLQI